MGWVIKTVGRVADSLALSDIRGDRARVKTIGAYLGQLICVLFESSVVFSKEIDILA